MLAKNENNANNKKNTNNKTEEPERYIVTSALPYVNGIKHLGNFIGSLLPADVYARYLRLRGKDVVAVCGTDEHGTPAEIAALEEGLPVEEYCQKYYEIQKKIYEQFGLCFDYFGRTSAPENHQITQDIFLKLWKNGLVFEKETEQLYCLNDQRFLPDRYVEGECPHCGYFPARGDQCEGCSTLLNPPELINPKCKVCGQGSIEIRKTKHLYLDLPKMQDKVAQWIKHQNHWPLSTRSIAEAWLKEGLRPRAITRNLKWGIPVPLEKYKDLVFYVWFDAPIGYISITAQWAKEIKKDPELWKQYWKNSTTRLIQFMGVDNVPFHTVTWPATLMGADDGYILAYMVKGFHWLMYEGGKFSTSQNRGIFLDKALELYPPDYWRYYLLYIAPENQNTSFEWDGFQQAVNHHLNNALGNFAHRTVTFLNKECEGVVPKLNNPNDEEIKALQKVLQQHMERYIEYFEAYEFQKATQNLYQLWQEANKFFQQREPWKHAKEGNNKHVEDTLSSSAHLLRSIAILSAPFIPFTAEKIYDLLGYQNPTQVHEERWEQVFDFECLVGQKVTPNPKPLFKKISEKEKKKYQALFNPDIREKGTKEEKGKLDESKKKRKTVEAESSVSGGLIGFKDFQKVEIRVGTITKAEKVSWSKKLIRMEVDFGKEQRVIFAGIAEKVDPSELEGKQAPFVVNLKPKKMRKEYSQGMMLIAVLEGEEDFVPLHPAKPVPPGTKVE